MSEKIVDEAEIRILRAFISGRCAPDTNGENAGQTLTPTGTIHGTLSSLGSYCPTSFITRVFGGRYEWTASIKNALRFAEEALGEPVRWTRDYARVFKVCSANSLDPWSYEGGRWAQTNPLAIIDAVLHAYPERMKARAARGSWRCCGRPGPRIQLS